MSSQFHDSEIAQICKVAFKRAKSGLKAGVSRCRLEEYAQKFCLWLFLLVKDTFEQGGLALYFGMMLVVPAPLMFATVIAFALPAPGLCLIGFLVTYVMAIALGMALRRGAILAHLDDEFNEMLDNED